MTSPKLRRTEDWQAHQRDEDAASAAERYEREYYANRQQHSAANYPQYLAENQRYRQDHAERYGQPRHVADDGRDDYRYGDQPRFSPLRFGGYDEVRNDSFGYTEVERQPHSFGPYARGGREIYGQPHPGYYDPVYGNVGVNWSGPGYLHNPQQFQHGSSNQHPRHPDPDYHQWRAEQIRKLDSDYDQWRQERYHNFSKDFDSWRAARPSHGPLPIDEPTAAGSANKPDSLDSQTHGATLPASSTKR